MWGEKKTEKWNSGKKVGGKTKKTERVGRKNGRKKERNKTVEKSGRKPKKSKRVGGENGRKNREIK